MLQMIVCLFSTLAHFIIYDKALFDFRKHSSLLCKTHQFEHCLTRASKDLLFRVFPSGKKEVSVTEIT